MYSIRILSTLVIVFGGALSALPTSASWYTYTPGSEISMTGSNTEVFFDVADDIQATSSTERGARLITGIAEFDGAFYLSGAGWVDFSTGSYQVELDCGGQSLGSLTSPCTLSGTAYGELIGDVVFDRRVIYDPIRGDLSGTASTLLGEYRFDSVRLPLLPAFFSEGTGSLADHAKSLTISGGIDRYGDGVWRSYFTPLGLPLYSRMSGYPFLFDLSASSLYRVMITDPSGSMTELDFEVSPGIPSTSLLGGTYLHRDICISGTAPSLCPDGSILAPTRLDRDPMSSIPIANGVDRYKFLLELRDRYGNDIKKGKIKIEYRDRIRTLQVDPLEYFGDLDPMMWLALYPSPIGLYGDPVTGIYENVFSSLALGVGYTIFSIAPTSPTDTLTLSGVTYETETGTIYDITDPSWRDPLIFAPWYTTAITAANPLAVGAQTLFTTSFTNQSSPSITPTTPTGIYHIDIGTNTMTAYTGYTSSAISCTKYVIGLGNNECNWFITPDTSIISTDAATFSGTYDDGGYDPPPENISYRSYIRYVAGGTPIVYPGRAGSLGTSTQGPELMKILGNQNIRGSRMGIGADEGAIWNTLRKNIALLSRNRTSYADVDYEILIGDQTITNSAFASKRTIIVIGGDATLSSEVIGRDRPVALIALTDEAGNGGNIIIGEPVTDITASLYAERVIRSRGDHQLYINGSVISRNTASDTVCPYFAPTPCYPSDYNLEKIRSGYADLLSKIGYTASSPRAREYPDVSLIIEYDGRILSDPPPGFEK